jgi:hypothetical protein
MILLLIVLLQLCSIQWMLKLDLLKSSEDIIYNSLPSVSMGMKSILLLIRNVPQQARPVSH